MADIRKVSRRKMIGRFLDYWEYLIDQHVPASEKQKKTKAAKATIKNDSDNAVHYISVQQLNQVKQDIELIQTVRDIEKQNQLIENGQPVLKIVQQCFNLFKEGQKKLVMKEVDKQRQVEMREFCNDAAFEKAVNQMVAQP